MSKFDALYRSLLLTKFFTKGWGQPESLKRIFEFRKVLSNRETCQKLVPNDYPIVIDKKVERKEYCVMTGHFVSPLNGVMPDIMPTEVKMARFEMILPIKWNSKLKPVVVHLAGTGDHGFGRRRTLLAKPLLKEFGIASIILENPFYGTRKPKSQLRSSLHNVSDLFVMGGALVLESLALFHWCEKQGYGPLAITGISMGGFMASLAATNWHKPISLIPCLSWSTASTVFTQGVMSGAIPWKMLQKQYEKDSIFEDSLKKLLISPEELIKMDAFRLGQEFAKHYPCSLADMIAYQQRGGQNIYLSKEDRQMECESKKMNEMPDLLKSGQSGILNHIVAANANKKSSESAVTSKNANTSQNTNSSDTSKWNHNSARTFLNFSQWKTAFTYTNAITRSSASWLGYLNFPTKSSKSSTDNINSQALHFMRGVMDECTHLGNFSTPVDTSLIIIVAAKHDAYVPRDTTLNLQDLWPGSEVRYVDTGHINAFLTKQPVFRKAIRDSIQRQIDKYYADL